MLAEKLMCDSNSQSRLMEVYIVLKIGWGNGATWSRRGMRRVFENEVLDAYRAVINVRPSVIIGLRVSCD